MDSSQIVLANPGSPLQTGSVVRRHVKVWYHTSCHQAVGCLGAVIAGLFIIDNLPAVVHMRRMLVLPWGYDGVLRASFNRNDPQNGFRRSSMHASE